MSVRELEWSATDLAGLLPRPGWEYSRKTDAYRYTRTEERQRSCSREIGGVELRQARIDLLNETEWRVYLELNPWATRPPLEGRRRFYAQELWFQ